MRALARDPPQRASVAASVGSVGGAAAESGRPGESPIGCLRFADGEKPNETRKRGVRTASSPQ